MKDEKKVIFLYDDPQFGMVIGGELNKRGQPVGGGILGAIRSYLCELEDGEAWTVTIRRCDMTEAELEAAPEL